MFSFPSIQYWVWQSSFHLSSVQWSCPDSIKFEEHNTLAQDSNRVICQHTFEWKWQQKLTNNEQNNNNNNHDNFNEDQTSGKIILIIKKETEQQEIKFKQIADKYTNPLITSSSLSSQKFVSKISLKISNLQKAIRRRETAIALRTTWDLIQNDNKEATLKLLRRLPIILVEDAILHPALDSIVFLMLLCSKNWILTLIQKTIILQIVQAICELDVPADRRCGHIKEIQLPKVSTDRQASLLFALFMRANYGGMGGDINLLYNTITFWKDRFSLLNNDINTNNNRLECWFRWFRQREPPLWQIKQWKFQIPEDQLLVAVDFHCSNILTTLLRKHNLPLTSEPLLKSLIWKTRSAVYHRSCICQQHNSDSNSDSDCEIIDSPSFLSKWLEIISLPKQYNNNNNNISSLSSSSVSNYLPLINFVFNSGILISLIIFLLLLLI